VARRPPAGGPLTGADRDPGLFGPKSHTWRIDREAFLLLGIGPRALLLQIAHPAVAAGVADHSDFRADPWSRLAGTVRSYLRITYGTTAEARAEVRRLNALHRTVRGRIPGGGAYAARDPDLALWVHATLVDSTIAGAHEWLAPLDADARARIYAESIPVARAFGIPPDRLPPDVDAFDAYVAGMLGPGGPVHPGPVAKELAGVILHPRPGPAIRTLVTALPGAVPCPILGALGAAADQIPSRAVAWLIWPAIGLLPPAVREAYGLPWGPAERAVSSWLVGAWRTWNGVLPTSWRWMSQAQAADRRMAPGRAGIATAAGTVSHHRPRASSLAGLTLSRGRGSAPAASAGDRPGWPP
jgi:uncharacterized protein (DUF2236 family)